MLADIRKKQEELDKRYYKSPRHQIQVDFIPYMDELALQFGAKPNLMRIFFTDYTLWYHLFFGPSLNYQYRLQGPHPWCGARDAILGWKDRVEAPFKTRKPDEDEKLEVNTLVTSHNIIMLFLALLSVIFFKLCSSF